MFTKYTNEPNSYIYIYTNNIVVKAKDYYCYPSSQRNIQISVFETDDPMDQSWSLTIPPCSILSLPPSSWPHCVLCRVCVEMRVIVTAA